MRIGDVAGRLGVSRDTLRRLEREGAVAPARDRAGQRRYTEGDIVSLRRVLFAKKPPPASAQE